MTEYRPQVAGFTLLEVLVALIIFALAFGVLTQIMQTGFRQSATAEATTTATLLARSLLARVGPEIPVETGRYQGDDADADYRWTTVIWPAEAEGEEAEIAAYFVRVTVAWGPAESEQAVELTTLRLGPPP